MSDAKYQIPIESRGGVETIPITFEKEELDLEAYLYLQQAEEDYMFEQMFEML